MGPGPDMSLADVLSSSRSAEIPAGRLEKLADRLAQDAEADHAGAFVDRADRVGRDEPAAAEKAGADGERVRHVRLAAVHRRLDPADHAAAHVGDEKAFDAAEVEFEGAHLLENLFPLREVSPTRCVRSLLSAR